MMNFSFQLNIFRFLRSYQNKRHMLFPVFWFDMNMRISKNSASLLKIIRNLEMYCHIFGALIIIISALLFLWRPLKRTWYKRYSHHMEINTMADDDGDNDGDSKTTCCDNKTKEALYTLPPAFPSLLYIASSRRSLPVIISHLDEDEEALNACLEDIRRLNIDQEFENMTEISENS